MAKKTKPKPPKPKPKPRYMVGTHALLQPGEGPLGYALRTGAAPDNLPPVKWQRLKSA